MDMKKHRHLIKSMEGQRSRMMDHAKAKQGWVFTSVVPEKFWDYCNLQVYPVRAVWYFGFIPSPAVFEQWKIEQTLGKNITFVLLYNEGISYFQPVRIEDLAKSVKELQSETTISMHNESPSYLMKLHTLMMVYGSTDLN